MTLEDLIRRFRTLAGDTKAPQFWKDTDITDWLNDAQVQACVRGRLLLEDANPAMCVIDIEADRHTYPLHRKLYELVHVSFKPVNGRPSRLKVTSREWLDANFRNWRSADDWHHMDCGARYVIQGETSLRIVPVPGEMGVLTIEAYRLPAVVMSAPGHEPEIHEASHEHLIQWALHKAFSVPDSEAFDPQRATKAEDAFTAYFGPLPDSDMRRIAREDTPHTVKVHP